MIIENKTGKVFELNFKKADGTFVRVIAQPGESICSKAYPKAGRALGRENRKARNGAVRKRLRKENSKGA